MAGTFIRTKMSGDVVARHASNGFEGLVPFITPLVSQAFIAPAVINACTQAAIGEFTTAAAHGLVVGDFVFITGIVGNLGTGLINDKIWQIRTRSTTAKFTLTDPVTGLAVPSNGASADTYTSDGTVVKVTYMCTLPVGAVPQGVLIHGSAASDSSSSASLNIGSAVATTSVLAAHDVKTAGTGLGSIWSTKVCAPTALTAATPLYLRYLESGAATAGAWKVRIIYTMGA